MKAKEKEDLLAALKEHLKVKVKANTQHDASMAVMNIRLEVELWWIDPYEGDILLTWSDSLLP
jgi:hypothetical protein